MTNPQAVMKIQDSGHDLVVATAMRPARGRQGPVKIAKHIGAVARDPGVPQERGHRGGQLRRRIHNQVRGPLALPQRPIVGQMRTEGMAHGGKGHRQKAVQKARPLPVELFTQATLRQGIVLDVQELVALAQEIHTACFQSAPQPFAPIESDLHVVRDQV